MTAESRLFSLKLPRGVVQPKLRPQKVKRKTRFSLLVLFRLMSSERSKRLFDIGFSLIILIGCAPLYGLIALLIKLSSPGSVFYIQERVGRNYRRFRCIKFRTMVDNADEMLVGMMARSRDFQAEFEENYKLKDDPRITLLGKFLRLTSLDELPQFWNVLKGDMSVVGPRPLVPEEMVRYGRYMKKVLSVRPGITGLWQVSGRNDIPYHRRVQIDVYYAGYRSLILDLSIILKTVKVILFPRNNGAY